MKTVTIIEGFAGGKQLSKKFADQLKGAGFKLIRKPSKADIIIAHSGGCYKIPKISEASLVLLIGIPYWPSESLVSRLIKETRVDNKFVIKQYGLKYWAKKKFWQTYYFFARPSIVFVAWTSHKNLDFLEEMHDKQIIVVRNKEDLYCTPDIERDIAVHKNVKFFELEGIHDDYYVNPRPYIDLLLKEL